MNPRKSFLALAALAVIGLGFQSASAATSTVTITPGGSVPVNHNAIATFTFSAGSLSIVLTNNFSDNDLATWDITAAIRGLKFTIAPVPNTGAISNYTATGNLITIDGSGNYSSATANTSLLASNNPVFTQAGDGWTIAGLDPYTIGVGATGNPVTGNNPLIVGNPDGANKYDNANASVAGNGPHNPVVKQTATFTMNINGLSANSTLTAATFYFGTGEDFGTGIIVNNPPDGGGGVGNPAPLPASVWGGMALIGGLAVVRRFKRKVA